MIGSNGFAISSAPAVPRGCRNNKLFRNSAGEHHAREADGRVLQKCNIKDVDWSDVGLTELTSKML